MKITFVSMNASPSVLSRSNRVMGVLENRHELESFIQEIEPLGVGEIEVLEKGQVKDPLTNHELSLKGLLDSIFGDLETELRKIYAREVGQGRLVFTAAVTDDNVDEVVMTAKMRGGKHLAHFGALIEESFETVESVRR